MPKPVRLRGVIRLRQKSGFQKKRRREDFLFLFFFFVFDLDFLKQFTSRIAAALNIDMNQLRVVRRTSRSSKN